MNFLFPFVHCVLLFCSYLRGFLLKDRSATRTSCFHGASSIVLLYKNPQDTNGGRMIDHFIKLMEEIAHFKQWGNTFQGFLTWNLLIDHNHEGRQSSLPLDRLFLLCFSFVYLPYIAPYIIKFLQREHRSCDFHGSLLLWANLPNLHCMLEMLNIQLYACIVGGTYMICLYMAFKYGTQGTLL